MRGSDRRLPEVALALASTLIALLVLEAGFRSWACYESRYSFEQTMARAHPPSPHATVTLAGLIRPSADRRIVYELWPSIDVLFDDSQSGQPVRVVTNAAGFRGRDYPIEKPPHARRIVGLGDSLMFGWGVEQGQDYLSLLEARLGPAAWQAINTAVPGYNTAMEVETLEARAHRYQPDLVVLGFCANDASLPNFILPRTQPTSMQGSFLLEFVRGRLRPVSNGDALIAAPRRNDGRAFEDDPARVPPAYRDIVGWEVVDRSLRRLQSLGGEHGYRLLVVAFSPETTDERKARGLRMAAEIGLPVLDVGAAEAAYMRARGIDRYIGSPLTVSARDAHPSPISHALAAAAIECWMWREGMLPATPHRSEPSRRAIPSERAGAGFAGVPSRKCP
jgi:lysophospholipase L1-like esterase